MARKFNEDYNEGKAVSFDLAGLEPQQEKAKPKPPDMSLAAVLDRLRATPRAVTFNSIRAGGYAVAIGDKVFKFKDHDFITSDPDEVELLMRCDRYGYDFFVLDAELRKAIR